MKKAGQFLITDNESVVKLNLKYFVLFFFCMVFSGCAWKPYTLTKRFSETPVSERPDYALQKNWAALPNCKDSADAIPRNAIVKDQQENTKIDVFFLHPTIFTGKPTNQFEWNADLNDTALNQQVDASTIRNQATAFNGVGRVYAPRYRQAHYYCFVTPNKEDKVKALDIAYEDLKASFEYYLKYYNDGRPIIIASHSQGTIHAVRLMRDFFDGKPLQKQLVAAYLVGIALPTNTFEHIKPSSAANELGGWVSWNTFAYGFVPDYYQNGLNVAVCTNPLTWRLDENVASEKLNVGAIGLNFKYEKYAVDAQCHKGLLWINKPYVKGRAFIRTKIWHRADINLFWGNIRQNAEERVQTYFLNRQ